MADGNKEKYLDLAGQTTEEYYNLAREQEYATLLDKDIQLENAKAQAQKYTQNQVNANGFGGTGYGSSIGAGVQNAYLNQVNKAREDYNNQINNLNLAERQEIKNQANDRFESVTTLINNATDQATMDKMLADYQYGTIDTDTGEFKWNETKPEGMSDDDWIQMKYIYENQKNNLGGGNNYTGAYYNTEDELMNYIYRVDGDNKKIVKDDFRYETRQMLKAKDDGTIPYGGVVKMTNANGEVIYFQYTQQGFRVANEETYNNANSKFTSTYKKGGADFNKV